MAIPPVPSPSASGVLHCLRMLAEEASRLQLVQTAEAIKDAITTLSVELMASAAPTDTTSEEARPH